MVYEDLAQTNKGKVRYRNFERQATNFTKLMFHPKPAERDLSIHQFGLEHCARNTFRKALLGLN